MTHWQADFYHHPSSATTGTPLWHLLICDERGKLILDAHCPQSQVNSHWLLQHLQSILSSSHPEFIAVFRPQSLSLFTLAGNALNIPIVPTRRTPALKKILLETYQSSLDNPLKIDFPPPQPLPNYLWGDRWQLASFPASQIVEYFSQQPIPFCQIDPQDHPLNLGIPSHHRISGIVIEGGRKAMILARWLAENTPYSLNYIPNERGKSGGLILESSLCDRWILATFEDPEIAQSAQQYEQRKQDNQGLHFLLVQPDETGITYSGFWLLRSVNSDQ